MPCQDHVPDRKLRRYPVREQGPFVFIWMGDPEPPDGAAFPGLPFLEDPGCRTMFEALDIQGSYLLMQENLPRRPQARSLRRSSFAPTKLPPVRTGRDRRSR